MPSFHSHATQEVGEPLYKFTDEETEAQSGQCDNLFMHLVSVSMLLWLGKSDLGQAQSWLTALAV